ncbi:MAG: sialidase family protein [Thermonemataceae bacterium]
MLIVIFSWGVTNICKGQHQLIVRDSSEHIEMPAIEHMLIEHPSGTLFTSGFQFSSKSPQLWKSVDKGKSWHRVDVGSQDQGADGNSDVDMVIDKEGSIYLISLRYDWVNPGDSTSEARGKHITVGVSHDVGKTWTWTFLSKTLNDDRPWIDVDAEGTVHAIWNDGKGVCHAISKDKGQSWLEQNRIYNKGLSSHLATGPNGTIAVRITPRSAAGYQFDEGVDFLAVSKDFGKTWSILDLPGKRDWNEEQTDSDTPRWVEPLAWDDEGSLYTMWSEGKELVLGVSKDVGKSWKTHKIAEDKELVFFPYLNSSPTGRIACTWFSGHNERLVLYAAEILLTNPTPTIVKTEPLQLSLWSKWEENTRWTGGEYIAIKFLQNGNLAMVTPIYNPNTQRYGFTWWELESSIKD